MCSAVDGCLGGSQARAVASTAAVAMSAHTFLSVGYRLGVELLGRGVCPWTRFKMEARVPDMGEIFET